MDKYLIEIEQLKKEIDLLKLEYLRINNQIIHNSLEIVRQYKESIRLCDEKDDLAFNMEMIIEAPKKLKRARFKLFNIALMTILTSLLMMSVPLPGALIFAIIPCSIGICASRIPIVEIKHQLEILKALKGIKKDDLERQHSKVKESILNTDIIKQRLQKEGQELCQISTDKDKEIKQLGDKLTEIKDKRDKAISSIMTSILEEQLNAEYDASSMKLGHVVQKVKN